MKIGAIIICRYNSSRLPGKILKPIEGKEILLHIYERLSQIQNLNITVATSIEITDDPIVTFCEEKSIPYFRGSLNNVSERFLKAAENQGLDYAIRVNGDNLFIDIEAMQEMMSLAHRNTYDFISNVKGRSFPFGMSIEIVKTTFYKSIFSKLDSDYYKEHVTIYFYENEKSGAFFFYYNTKVETAKGLKIAIDTADDFTKASDIVKKINMTSYNLKEIVEAYG